MTTVQTPEDRIADLEPALTGLLAALDAQDEDPRCYRSVDSARAAAVAMLENGRIHKRAPLPVAELLAGDYRVKAPSLEYGDADAEIAQSMTCEVCKKKGLTYLPYSNNGSYRAFAQCSKCGHTVEF